MSPNLIFYSGIAICCITVLSTIISIIVLSFIKSRLNKQFDSEYGKRRH